jgi:hypothetical protein
VECLFQALDELDDLVAILRHRWLRHAAERLEASPIAAAPSEPRLL